MSALARLSLFVGIGGAALAAMVLLDNAGVEPLVGPADYLANPMVMPATTYPSMPWDRKTEHLVNTRNFEVNRSITYVHDEDQYNKPEHMADGRITGKGDCEDYAWAKLLDLQEHGLCLKGECAVVSVWDGVSKAFHAVTMLNTSKGPMFLEMKYKTARSFDAAKIHDRWRIASGAIAPAEDGSIKIIDPNPFGLRDR